LYFNPMYASALLGGASLMINGQTFSMVPDANPLPLDPEVTTSSTSPFIVQVPHSLWGTTPEVTIQLTGLITDSNSPPNDATVLVAADLEGGAQEFLAINTAA